MDKSGWEAVNRVQEAIGGLRRGLHDDEIVLKYGVEPELVAAWRAVLGIRSNPPKRWKKGPPHEPGERDSSILAELRKGRTYVAVAGQFGITKQRVEQIARRWDLPRRRKGRRSGAVA